MTTNYHTAITTGAAANASTINSPLGELDAQLTTTQGEVTAARGGYATLDGRFDALVLAGGNVATLANGAASAGQKVVTVDSSTGFLAGAYVAYALAGGAIEYNQIDTVDSPTQITMTTNLGTGGIADNAYISMISPSEYQAANALNHDDDMTLPTAMQTVGRNVYFVDAYGADNTGTSYCGTELQAVFDAVDSAGGGVVEFTAGKTYKLDAQLDGVSVYSNTRVVGNGAKIYIANLTAGRVDSNECGLLVPDGETNIEISGLEFYGAAGDDVTHDEGQSAAIYLPGVSGAPYTDGVSIHHCYFHNLYGFTVHLAGIGYRVDVCDCVMTNCANGLNVNSHNSHQSRNHITNCDAIEASGNYTVIADNVLENCVFGISIGGHTSEGDRSIGAVVSGNRIVDTTSTVGISVNDGCTDTQIVNNTIVRPYTGGVQVVSSGDNPIYNVLIANNVIRSPGNLLDLTGRIGIYVASSTEEVTGVVIRGNLIYNDADDEDSGSGHQGRIGIGVVSSTTIEVADNVILGTDWAYYGLYLDTNAGVTLGRNVVAAGEILLQNNTYAATSLGGSYVTLGPWYQDNVAASQSAVALNLEGGNRAEIPMVVAGHIIGIAVYSNGARSAGTLTVAATINGTAQSGVGLTAVLNGSATTAKQTVVELGASAYVAGDLIGVKITTDGDWLPTTADITVSVLVANR